MQVHTPRLLAEIPTRVGPQAMREAIGATKSELTALEEEGRLVPRTRDPKVKNPWRIRDGVAFVANLAAGAALVPEDDAGLETLPHARKRTQVGLADLVSAISDQLLEIGQRAGVPGFHGLVLRKTDVDTLPSSRRRARAPLDVEPAEMVSAAAFGRLVGLPMETGLGGESRQRRESLVKGGHVRGAKVVLKASGRRVHELHRRDIPRLDQGNEVPFVAKALRGLLEANGVARFEPGGRDFWAVYPRADVSQVL